MALWVTGNQTPASEPRHGETFFPPVCKEGFPPWQPLCIHDGAALVGAVVPGTVYVTLLAFPVLHTPGGYQRNWCAIQFKTHMCMCVYARGRDYGV